MRAERRAAPKPARVPAGERRQASSFRLLGTCLPKRRSAGKPVGRPTVPSDEGQQ